MVLKSTIVKALWCFQPHSVHDCLQSIINIIFQLRTAAFKAYCAIWVRRSKFRHQAPRLSPRESTQRRKVELWVKNGR